MLIPTRFYTTNYASMKYFSVVISIASRTTCLWMNTVMSSHGMDQHHLYSAYPQWRFLDGHWLFAGIDVNDPSKIFVDSVSVDHRDRATPEPLTRIHCFRFCYLGWSLASLYNYTCTRIHTSQQKLRLLHHRSPYKIHGKHMDAREEKAASDPWDTWRPLQLIFGGVVMVSEVPNSPLAKKLHPVRKWRVWFGMKAER